MGLALSWWSRQVGAQVSDDGCLDGQLHVEGGFDADWSDAIRRACVTLEKLTDRDRGAKVELRPVTGGGGANVSLRLGDGRATERVAATPTELGEVLEALFALPPVEVAQPEVAKPEPKKANAPEPEAPTPETPKPEPNEAESPSSERPRFDLEIVGTARLAGAPTTVALGVVVAGELDIARGWLVGVRARVDPLLVDVDHHGEIDGLELGGGLELGRRIDAGVLAVDVGLGADALAEVPFDGRRRGSAANATRVDEVRGDVRPRAFGKIWVPARGFAFIGQVAVEVSPLHLADDRATRPGVGGELGAGVAWGGL